jgi:hypothetical protein
VYRHFTLEQLSKGLTDTAQELEVEARFMREVANGDFKLPKDESERLKVLLAHADVIFALRQRYEDLSRALAAKVGGA